MRIRLPKEFTLYDKRGENVVAYVENGELYLKRNVAFKDLQIKLAYCIYGKEICRCCGKEMHKSEVTIDHIIPQEVGGLTITNNLIPYCRGCNNKKTDMMPSRFKRFIECEDSKARREILKQAVKENETLKGDKKFKHFKKYLKPPEKLEIRMIKGYRPNYEVDREKSKKYIKTRNFYQTYGRLQKPVVVDKNLYLLGGYTSLKFLIDNDIDIADVVVLENVEIVD